MSIFSVGRMCVKIAGRDAGRKCVVVEQLDDVFVLVDGNVRRKKVNVKHLEPLAQALELNEQASHEDVKKAFEKSGWPAWDSKAQETAPKPRKQKNGKKGLKSDSEEPKKMPAEKPTE